MARPKPNIKKVRFNPIIREDQFKRLEKLAKESDEKSMSVFTREALDLYFKKIDEDNPKK